MSLLFIERVVTKAMITRQGRLDPVRVHGNVGVEDEDDQFCGCCSASHVPQSSVARRLPHASRNVCLLGQITYSAFCNAAWTSCRRQRPSILAYSMT